MGGDIAGIKAASTGQLLLRGLQAVDGVKLGKGDLVLVKDQADLSQNGVYEARKGRWRLADVEVGSLARRQSRVRWTIEVSGGSANAGTRWAANCSHRWLEFVQVLRRPRRRPPEPGPRPEAGDGSRWEEL